jgi:hypothetical protein
VQVPLQQSELLFQSQSLLLEQLGSVPELHQRHPSGGLSFPFGLIVVPFLLCTAVELEHLQSVVLQRDLILKFPDALARLAEFEDSRLGLNLINVHLTDHLLPQVHHLYEQHSVLLFDPSAAVADVLHLFLTILSVPTLPRKVGRFGLFHDFQAPFLLDAKEEE